jgi:ribose transport system ATP-binding protein
VLSGVFPPDAGQIELNGAPFVPRNPWHARQEGIAMIYQELNLAPHLSVEENILLGSEPARFGWLQRRTRRDLAQRALGELQHGYIPLNRPVQELTIAEQQLVEIARALVGEPRVIIMDEPTSSLTQVDSENLFGVIRRLRARGVSIVYISHFLEECQRVCDGYTVLRDGRSVAAGPMAEARIPDIIRQMVGREISDVYPRIPHSLGESVLSVRGLAGRGKPQSVSFNVRAGEIFGIAGLIGAGRTETLRVLFGLDRRTAGDIAVFGLESGHVSPGGRLGQGIGLLSENRKEEGLMLNRSLADNLTVTRFRPVSQYGLIRRRRQMACTQEWMDRLEVRAQSPAQCVGELSGGNQQKIALGRLLHHDARVFLLDEPTRGIDVGSKTQIYRLMGELTARGRSVVFVSSYLPELLGVCDTIGVMRRGSMAAVRPAAQWTEHEIIAAAVGPKTAVEGNGPEA